MPPIFAACAVRTTQALLLAAHTQGLNAAVSPPEPGYPEGRLLVATPPGGWYWPVQGGQCHRWHGVWRSAVLWDRIRDAWLEQYAAWQVLCGADPTAPIVAVFAVSLRKEGPDERSRY